MPQSVSMNFNQEFSIGPVTAEPPGAVLSGPISFSSDNPMLSIVVDSSDPTKATALGDKTNTGTATITVSDTVFSDTVIVTISTPPPPPETGLSIPLGSVVDQP